MGQPKADFAAILGCMLAIFSIVWSLLVLFGHSPVRGRALEDDLAQLIGHVVFAGPAFAGTCVCCALSRVRLKPIAVVTTVLYLAAFAYVLSLGF